MVFEGVQSFKLLENYLINKYNVTYFPIMLLKAIIKFSDFDVAIRS